MGLLRRRADQAELRKLRDEMRTVRDRISRHDEQTASFRSRLGVVDERLGPACDTSIDQRLSALAARLETLDDRITSVSAELTNQLTELGNDIDGLASRSDGTLDAQAVGDLRRTQTRLATEQARYQLAFREDLARLADQLRRPSSSG